MKNSQKYRRGYFLPPVMKMKWAKRDCIDKAPTWCSVDLRDGNQALVIPLSLEEKLEFFKYLVKIGFKEIEIGFPAASDTEFEFTRRLIEDGLIPDGVAIQVLTQARRHIIERTFEALKGAKNAIVHLYNSTSVAQREQVFKKSREEIEEIAVSGAKMLKEYRQRYEGNFRFEYSPESFTGTEPEYALKVCNAVLDVWQPTKNDKAIINLPVTVSMSMPHVYASQVEYMCDNLKFRENVIVSLHPHNDRGCAVADTELGLLAGADRVEGTLFGNGERTGNADIVTVALNMYSHGIDPGLDFSDMKDVVQVYEKFTKMVVGERHPYSGSLVFAAFSGSHQDAIAKGMRYREENKLFEWSVPYLPIDPKDVGREYDADVIRINSQSGKGGIAYLLERNSGFDLPGKMREEFSYFLKGVSDREHRELHYSEILEMFKENYVNKKDKLQILKKDLRSCEDGVSVKLSANILGAIKELKAFGNGGLDSVSNAIKEGLGLSYSITEYKEHALEKGSASSAAAYVCIESGGKIYWGAGIDTDIMNASIDALVSAVNKLI